MVSSSVGQSVKFASNLPGQITLLGLFGYPVEHSLSPAMHNAAIASLGLSQSYIPFSVRPEDIGPAIRSIVTLGIRGVNLTIPHKVSVLPFLDEISPEAQMAGAVNTVLNDNGRLKGFTTDGVGLSRSLSEAGQTLESRRVLLLGAGGAARSAAFRLLKENSKLTIVNRNVDRLNRLVSDLSAAYPLAEVKAIETHDIGGFRKALEETEILINATSAGMFPDVDAQIPVPSDSLHPKLFTFDMIYNPRRTRLLEAAFAAGGAGVNGLPMLVYQGAESFRIWTGIEPPTHVMLEAAEKALSSGQA